MTVYSKKIGKNVFLFYLTGLCLFFESFLNHVFSNISHYSEITKKISEVKNLIKSLRKYSLNMTKTGQKIIDYIIQSCTDDEVISWLKTLPHQIQFINLLTFLNNTVDQDLDRQKKEKLGGHIDIVIVAHGEITDKLIPAGLLMPTSIIDTVLYSPWNCLIDACAACAIAEGWKNTEGRDFYNQNQSVLFEPNPLPGHWNHMQRSFLPVPMILLTPLYPEEPVWKEFQRLQGQMDRDDRVIIPYLVPQDCVEAFGKTPFFMLIFALSYRLMIIQKTATVHLAACLGRGKSELFQTHWRAQYAYTNDRTIMTTRNRDFMNSRLFRAFRAMFDMNSR